MCTILINIILGKYKFMELNLLARKKKLKSQIPDIQKSLDMIQVLEAKRKTNEQIETHFLLSDLLYSRAVIEPTDTVCLWLGVNNTNHLDYDIFNLVFLLFFRLM